MFGLTDSNTQKIRFVLGNFPEIEKVILYGSRAKGNFRPSSDIDITLMGEALSIETLNRLENQLDDLLLPYTFDISILAQVSNPDLLNHIHRIGIEFYKKQ